MLPGLPLHAAVIDALRREVERRDVWRWLELSCSLAADRGDPLSDIDVGIGHELPVEDLRSTGLALTAALGTPLDVLAHREESWPPGILRFAVEYATGVQLDLVIMPVDQRPGLPEGSIAVVDKDGWLSTPWTPPVATTNEEQAREWVMLGWWALSNTAKHVRRGSLFEAVESLREARTQMLRVFAASRRVPYPSFGLTSLLDFEPFGVPGQLEETYSTPGSPTDVIAAALTIADLLTSISRDAGEVLGGDLSTPWRARAETRLLATGDLLRSE